MQKLGDNVLSYTQLIDYSKKAAESGNMELVKFLVSEGVTNFRDFLKGACRGGSIDIVKYALEQLQKNNLHNGTINTISFDVSDACDDACGKGHLKIVEFLEIHFLKI